MSLHQRIVRNHGEALERRWNFVAPLPRCGMAKVLYRCLMRTEVTFCHPAPFVPVSPDDGILAVSGAEWFATLLRSVPGLEIDQELCQEDWGVVFFARREGKSFWIGLSEWENEGSWRAQFHHGAFAWLQSWSPWGRAELERLIRDVGTALEKDSAFKRIEWHEAGT